MNATGPSEPRPHFSGFEALRAVAATMVVIHHAAALVRPGRSGRLDTYAQVFDSGVAVFFVMSGFLLWRPVVVRSLADAGTPGVARFWWRRVLRIVPAYWVVLSFFWWVGAFELGHHWWRYYLFLQIYSSETVLGGIVPSWSLCTEMAFYLVLPAFAWMIDRFSHRFSASVRPWLHLGFCGLLWIGGFVARYVVDHRFPSRRGLAFEWMPQNLDLFATGMGLAALSAIAATSPDLRAGLDRVTRWVWPWWLAAAALFTWYAYRVGPTSFEVGYTGWFWHQRQLVLGVFTALLLAPVVFGPETGLLRRLWSLRPVVWCGLVSYGLYLWHLNSMEWAAEHGWFGLQQGTDLRVDTPLVVMAGVGLVLGFLAAAMSWYGLERPLQRFRSLVPESSPVPRSRVPER